MAQVPQGVGYQGVATDANGIELVNQSISIRASVLSGSANGTVEWEETHATSTDTFGLFALTIGQGTSTGNGAQLSFADISWGTNTHYLKIEIDVTGGANYSFMGTNQMMSVPYALYAENANINYDSISNLLSNDTTFITNVGGGIGGGGCDFQYPDGLNGEVINLRFSLQGSYTVPLGKTLYVTNFFGDDPSCYLSIDFNNINGAPQIINGVSNYRGIQGNNVPGLLLPIIVGEGETLSGGGGNASCNGLLVDKGVTPITWQLGWGSYTVPVGKKLYILNSNDNGSGQSSYFYIDDGNGNQTIQNGPTNSTETNSFGIPLILGENTILSGNPTFNGYLVDENYFAGCGGGGSSSTSSLDSTAIANMIAGAGGGCDLIHPDGFNGFEAVVYDFLMNGDYTVPSGKNLYIGSIKTDNTQYESIMLNGMLIDLNNYYAGAAKYLIASNNDIISVSNLGGQALMYGFLVDANVESVSYEMNSPFTVPSNKIFVYHSIYSNTGDDIYINGLNVAHLDPGGANPVPMPSGTTIAMDNMGQNMKYLYGYLVDENYFAGCGVGGGSSATTVDYDSLANIISMDSTFINNVGSGIGEGCSFKFPEGLDGEGVNMDLSNITYTVPVGKRLYVTNYYDSGTGIWIDGVLAHYNGDIASPIIVNEGQTISTAYNVLLVSGYLVSPSIHLDAINMDLSNITYTVPAGKRLYVTNYYDSGTGIWIDGVLAHYNGDIASPIIVNEGQTISTAYNVLLISGYLVDENYFAGCGGGGSPNNFNANLSSLSNNLIAYNDISNQYSGSFNYSMCQNSNNTPTCIVNIPPGKIMKITNIGASPCQGSLNINGQIFLTDWVCNPPLYLSEGEFEYFFPNNNIPDEYYNIQYDLIDNVNNLVFNYIHLSGSNNLFFQVPPSKTMKITYLKYSNQNSAMELYVNGQFYCDSNSQWPEFFESGDTIEFILDSPQDMMSIQYLLFDN